MNEEQINYLIDQFVIKNISLEELKEISTCVNDKDFQETYSLTENISQAIKKQELDKAKQELSKIIKEESLNEQKVKIFQFRSHSIQVAAIIFFICACSIVIRMTTSYNDEAKFKKINIQNYAKA